VRDRDALGERVEGAGVDVARLEYDDRGAVAIPMLAVTIS